jgi:NitT/TauT family transport system substrate-binding protein
VHVRSRAQILTGAGALVLANRTAVHAQTLMTVRFGATPLVDCVPIAYAQGNGAFRAAGFDVQITKLTSTSAIAAALVGGSLDMGEVSAVPLINAHIRGVDLKIVYPNVIHITGRPYYSAIVVAADSPIRNGRDFNGKTMSSAAIGDSAWVAARVFIDANGGDSSTVKFVEIPFSAVPAAIETGRIEAGVIAEPFFSQAVRSGKARSAGDLTAGLGLRSIQTTYAATNDYIVKNREALSRFVRVVREVHEYFNSHKPELAAATETFTGVPRAQQAPETVTYATDAGPRDLQTWIAAAAKYGTIPRTFDAAELFVNL